MLYFYKKHKNRIPEKSEIQNRNPESRTNRNFLWMNRHLKICFEKFSIGPNWKYRSNCLKIKKLCLLTVCTSIIKITKVTTFSKFSRIYHFDLIILLKYMSFCCTVHKSAANSLMKRFELKLGSRATKIYCCRNGQQLHSGQKIFHPFWITAITENMQK